MYKSFSYYYDKMMSDIDYDFFINIAKKYISKDKKVIDIGCGTGTITSELKKNGYEICGMDNSSDMLVMCHQKMIDSNVFFPIFENSIEEEMPEKSFDVAISFLDVMNYVDYKKAFKNVYNCLNEKGIFLFDVDQVSYINEIKGYEENDSYEDFKYQWKILDGGKDAIIHDLKIIDNKNNSFSEKHFQKTYDKEVYVKELEDLGFDVTVLPETDEVKVFIKAIKK